MAVITSPVTEFFRATDAHESDALVRTFAHDAVLYNADEGTYAGHDGIRRWNDKEFLGANCTVDVTSTVTTGKGEVIVTGDTRGDFPGDRIVLFYLFTVRDGLIASVTIHH
jgi:SnoaL-like domain